jgi:co-chaperonin GroES (HSP10)
MQINPLGRRCHVILDPVEEKMVKSIIVPRDHPEQTRTGKIISLGEKVTVPVKPGDRIMVMFHAGVIIDWMDNTMSQDDTNRIINEDEILMTLTE